MTNYYRSILHVLAFFIVGTIFFVPDSNAQNLSTDELSQLKYRHIGPIGNRLTCVAGVSGDPMTYFVGAASGGIWKTEDGGLDWKPIFTIRMYTP